jgi:serine/threonine protein kinase
VTKPRGPDRGVAVHRVRVPHGGGEINLVLHVVDDDLAHLPESADYEATSVHASVRAQRPSQQALEPRQPVEMILGPGGRVGKYELIDQLGQGTFGLVFKGKDTDLDREVAVKVLNPSHNANGDILHRFLQEARASARIAHPGIVTVLDCGKASTHVGETAYIVLELLQGESLTNRVTRSGRLAPGSAIEITRQIASAIDAAHRVDVLHRDLKPDNVYLVPDPAVPTGERVKVLDFGLAKLGASRHTTANTVFGTPRYMSPEQCRSAALIDHRSDIYSLGCILFELVTGRTPFDGDLRQLIERHQRTLPPRAKSFAPEISDQLDELIWQMLAKDPNHRPQSMGAVQAALYNHGAVVPGAAATMMPVPASLVSLPQQQQAPRPPHHDSGMLLHRPHTPYREEKTAQGPRKRRKAPIAAAAIAFFVAAALTAVAARGRTRSADASPAQTEQTSPLAVPSQ